MRIEIWSDVICPFCYIGKRRLEQALAGFENRDAIDIQWKSFQLNPHMETMPGKSINEYLAETKGWTLEYSARMNQHVTSMAREAGLEYHLDQAVVANSFDAHRLLQLAKTKGLGHTLEELLFKAYFTEGRNTADHDVLMQIGLEAGLDKDETGRMLQSDAFAPDVNNDIMEARELGVQGVPFFVFNREYGISGAQPAEQFSQTLEKAFQSWKASQ